MHAVPVGEEEAEALCRMLSLVLDHGIVVSAAAARSNPTGRLSPQSAAYSKGMRWGGMRQP
jgi:citrate synthase